jgi:hypothetical protein
MGKRKWQRITLNDLASEAKRREILNLISQAKGHPEPELSHKRPLKSPQVER